MRDDGGYTKSEVAEERAIDRKSSFNSLLPLSTVETPEQPCEAGDHERDTRMESVTNAISESYIPADYDKGEVKMESATTLFLRKKESKSADGLGTQKPGFASFHRVPRP
ncbi:hypothetical protein SGCOL_003696 [Colletotrichum sp. CLE4]